MFTAEDLVLFEKKNIPAERVARQLNDFREGFPFLKLAGSASVDKGIFRLSEAEEFACLESWEHYLKGEHLIQKFVPASGAASRMFKDLFEFLENPEDKPLKPFEIKFFNEIRRFAFYSELNNACLKNEGLDIEGLLNKGAYKAVVQNLLGPGGLNYGALPKGLLRFHRYGDECRKAVVEHLVEGALYARSSTGIVHVHFTVSPEHLALFEQEIKDSAPAVENACGVRFDISFSEQKASTDTVAADAENMPFRENGKILFRPGGHGALIENLNDLDADVVFIKNIDNVVPDRLKDTTVKYKKILAGLLVKIQERAFGHLKMLESGFYTHDQLLEVIHFVQHELCTRNPEIKNLEDSELVLYLKSKLNRPIRICGMVRNEGEPGGGPFWAYNQDGSISLQILESSQIDLNDPEKKSMFEQGTHFNPVDLVCALRDSHGKRFDLRAHVDHQTAFISSKSKSGKELKALELPGLWNGAMSDWSTLFVEVPALTFNPVKTVNDLLRNEHQQ